MNRIVFDLQLFASITNTTGNTLVSGTSDADTIKNGGSGAISNITITSGAGNDSIRNYFSSTNVSINAGDGNNYIDNYGSNVTITSGTGNDKIYNGGSNVTINSGAGNDSIYNGGSNVSINAGAGNDNISIAWGETSNVTITSGEGNDTMSLSDESKKITITDFDASDKILMNYEPTFAKFANKVLNIDGIKIALPNVTNIDKYRDMTISYYAGWDEETEEDFINEIPLGELLDAPAPYWKLSGTTATYYDADGTLLATLTGLKSGLKVVDGEIAGIDVNHYGTITLSKSVLGSGTVTLNNSPMQGHNLALADDVTKADFEQDDGYLKGTWSITGTTATYSGKSKSAGYYIADNQVRYIAKNTAVILSKITGVKNGTKVNSNGSITGIDTWIDTWDGYLNGDILIRDASIINGKVTVDSGIVTTNFSGYEVDLGDDEWDYVVPDWSGKVISGTANSDNIGIDTSNSTGVSLGSGKGNDDVNIWGGSQHTLDAGDGNDWVHVSGSTDTSVYGGAGNDFVGVGQGTGYFVDAGAGDDYIDVTDTQVATINAGAGNDTVFLNDGHHWDYYYDEETDEYYSFEYRGTLDQVTVNGGAGNDFITSSDSKVTNSVINADDGNDRIQIFGKGNSVSGGNGDDNIFVGSYTDTEVTSANTINGGLGNDEISIEGEANVIQYVNGDGNDTIFGYDSSNTLQIAGDYTTVQDGENLIINVGSGSITLVDFTGKAKIDAVEGESNKIKWTVSKGTATGKIGKTVVATIKGLKTTAKASHLSDYGNSIIVANAALGTTKVTLTSSLYTLALGSDVTKSNVVEKGWFIDEGTATYKTENSTAGYYIPADGKSIVPKKDVKSTEVVKLTGLAEWVSEDDLTLNTSKKTVTVNANALDEGTVTISDKTNKYVLVLADDVKKSVATKAGWAIDGDTAEYTTAEVTTGYALASDKKSVTYKTASGGEMVATLEGLKAKTKASDLSVKDGVITIGKNALNPKNVITLDTEGDYALAIGSGAKKSATTAEGWYTSSGTATYVTEKTTAGYAVFDDGKSIEYISETDGGDTLVKLTGLKSKVKPADLSTAINGNVVTIAESVRGSSGVGVSGEGYEFKLSSAGKMTNKGKKVTLTGSSGDDTLIGSKYADTIQGGEGKDSLSGGNGADKLYANGGDTLIGGLGNDSLYATAGENNTLSGGSGKDSFYFTAGSALVTDYSAGNDKIYLEGDYTYEVSGKNVVFTTSGGTLTVKNGKGKKITVNDSTQKYSASSGLFAEDNFATEDNLSAIVENNLVGDFEFTSSEKLSQENLIAYVAK